MSPFMYIWGISSFKRFSIEYKDSSPIPILLAAKKKNTQTPV